MGGGAPCTHTHTHTQGHVFGSATSQEDVYRLIGAPLVRQATMGLNTCAFAYGQTGSGKTHTIVGSLDGPPSGRGLIPRCVEGVFAGMREKYGAPEAFSVTVTYLELCGRAQRVSVCLVAARAHYCARARQPTAAVRGAATMRV